MSEALYQLGGLPFWTETEIKHRDTCVQFLVDSVRLPLTRLNSAWQFHRVEGPVLSPRSQISAAYSDDDLFLTNHTGIDNEQIALRAETTQTSYAYARFLMQSHDHKLRLPLCIWQVGKSFRRELSDGATAAKLRFNEFYQLEFQCIYNVTTKADLRAAVVPSVEKTIRWLTNSHVKHTPHTTYASRVIPSDRLPSYSEQTDDVEVPHNGQFREMASISTRNDFSEDTRVLEVAIGLDRLVSVYNANRAP